MDVQPKNLCSDVGAPHSGLLPWIARKKRTASDQFARAVKSCDAFLRWATTPKADPYT
jgi:hypothetical protein